jgi:hypothetical protein
MVLFTNMDLKIIHLNIEKSKHLDSVFDLLKEQQPDVVCLEEVMYSDMKRFTSELGYELVFAPLVIIKNEKGEDNEGSAILSRIPVVETKIYRYDDQVNTELPTYIEGQFVLSNGKREKERWLYHNSLLTVTILINGEIVTISTTHFPVTDHGLPGLPEHTLPDLDYIDDIEHARVYLDRLISIINKITTPLVFTSDLNNTRNEYVYTTLAHELVDLVPNSVNSTLDSKLHRIPGLQLVVDTIMVSPDVSVKDFKIIEGVSDHKAFIALLEF